MAERCRGIIASDDPTDKPLTRCRSHALDEDDYCGVHAAQRERQDRLRSALKPDWQTRMVRRRGRPPKQPTRTRKAPPLDAPKPRKKTREKTPVVAPPRVKAPEPVPLQPKPSRGLPDRDKARELLRAPIRRWFE